jgi:thioredoxin-related protein
MRNLLILIAIFTLACSSAKKTTQAASDKKAQTEEVKKDSIFLYFERTLCYGECPAFKITVFSDGRSLYEGVRFVEKIGEYEARLSAAQMKEISEEAVRIGFYEFQDKYDASVSDVPTCITMISSDKGRKRVEDRFDGPDVLHAFEKYLDSILLGLDWKYRD